MRLTIGMACYDDFYGMQMTVQALRMGGELEPDDEFVIVDNHPDSEHGQLTQSFVRSCADQRIKYIPYAANTGTTQSRELVFSAASGDAVLCCDCHVLFQPGAIRRLKRWYTERPEPHLYHGPIVMTNLRAINTHFNDFWRNWMWGTWGSAFACPQCGTHFTTQRRHGQVTYWDLATCQRELAACRCRNFPPLDWPGHEQKLAQSGYRPLGVRNEDAPFEIPAQGLGVFTCRKDAWLGFNANFRMFGGEEWYIHTKYRLAGRKVVLLPWLKWWHRFERIGGQPYPNSRWGHLRNYVLGLSELGLSLQPAYDHFVSLDTHGLPIREHLVEVHSKKPDDLEGKSDDELHAMHRGMKFSDEEWAALLADPVGLVERPRRDTPFLSQEPVPAMRPQPASAETLDVLFDWTAGQKRDLDQHLPLLRELARQCPHATGIEKRRESSVALAYAGQYASFQKEADPLLQLLQQVRPYELHLGADSLEIDPIPETDLLFIDSVHSAARLAAELQRHAGQVRRFLVLRGTGAFGIHAEGSKEPGLFGALRPWLEEHPDWFVSHHAQSQYGFTVLSREPADRPARPIMLWPPGFGPGTEFAAIASELHIEMPDGCSCKALVMAMDISGVPGCRTQRDYFIGQIQANQERWGWRDRIANFATAGFSAVLSGLAFRINPLDPIPSLYDEAIRRAEEKEARS